MSTEYPVFKQENVSLDLCEHSSLFDFCMDLSAKGGHLSISFDNLNSDQVLDIAAKLIIPLLYNEGDEYATNVRARIEKAIKDFE